MKDLRRRSITAVVYGVAVILALLAPPFVFWAVLVVIGAVALVELARLRTGVSSVLVALLFIAGLASLGALRALGPYKAHHALAGDLPVWLLLVLVPTWAADVAAYLAGSTIGRRKLAPRVSPGKTWEGTIAGFVACALVAFGVGAAFGLGRLLVVFVAIFLGPIGLAGDLSKSYVKRRAGVKDSGTLFPGHGGVVDRLDSTVAGAIFVLACVWLASLGWLGGLG
ncbi:MAG TPA: phosphatidate cytidylyltransferase [Candidatus Limnocylindria bacterium]